MANIPQNDTYGQSTDPAKTPGVGYKAPSTLYQNIGQLRDRYNGVTAPTPMPGSPEDFQNRQFQMYSNLKKLNNGQGLPTMTHAYSPEGDPHTPIPIPSDYGTFQNPQQYKNEATGEDISWGTPASPVIRNLNAGDVPSQYVQDTANTELLVKTKRGENRFADSAMLNGRPGFLYQIDHTMPLELGGADTLANRQVLTNADHIKKTRAQSVAYTLYAHKKISLGEARAMAANWRDKDVEDIPDQNSIGLIPDQDPTGFASLLPWNKKKTGLEIALEAQKKWSQPAKITLKDVIAGIPEAASNFGKDWMPEDVRAFTMSATSALTAGFVSSDIGHEKDTSEKISSAVGYIAGNLFLFSKILNLVKVPYAAWGARQMFAKTAAKTILTPATKRAIVMSNYKAGGTLSGLTKAGVDAKILEAGAGTTNKAVGFLAKTFKNPVILENTGMFAATNAVMGAASRYVQNHLRPEILSGQEMSIDEKNTITNVLKDLAMGAIPGAQSPTIKGTLYAGAIPATLTYWQNPDEPLDAIVNGVVFGAMHAHGSLNVPSAGVVGIPKYKVPKGYNDIKAFGGKAYVDPVTAAQIHVVDHGMNATLNYWSPDLIPSADVTKSVPVYPKDHIDNAVNSSIENILKAYLGVVEPSKYTGIKDEINTALDNPTGKTSIFSNISKAIKKNESSETKKPGPLEMTQDEVRKEIARVVIAGRHLYKRSLPEQADPLAPGSISELRGKADIDDIISLTEKHLGERSKGLLKILDTPDSARVAATILTDPQNAILTRGIMSTHFRSDSGLEDIGFLAGSNPQGNSPEVKKFIEEIGKYDPNGNYIGDAADVLLAVRRPEMAPLLRMKNQWVKMSQSEKLADGTANIDITPQNAVQMYGVRKINGEIVLVDLGYVASDYRLNEGKYAINKKHLGEGKFGLTKDNIVNDVMGPKDLDVMLVSPSIRSVGNKDKDIPYLFFKISDDGIRASEMLNTAMKDKGYVKPVESAATDAEIAVNNIKMKGNDPAAKKKEELRNHPDLEEATKYLPQVPEGSNNARINETTGVVLSDAISVFRSESPEMLKRTLQSKFGLNLNATTAMELWNKRQSITQREMYDILYVASQTGKLRTEAAIRVEMVHDYISSGALDYSPLGKAALDLPILGNKPQPTAQPELPISPTDSIDKKETTPQKSISERIPQESKKAVEQTKVVFGPTKRKRANGTDVNAQYDRKTNTITIDGDALNKTFEEKAWTKPKVEGVTPLPVDAFKTPGEWIDFNLAHEKAHVTNTKMKDETPANYENRINAIAIEQVSKRYSGKNVYEPENTEIMDAFSKKDSIDEEQRRISEETVAAQSDQEVAAIEAANLEFKPNYYGIKRPKFNAVEFNKSIEENLSSPIPAVKYWAQAYDTAMKAVLGDKYKLDKKLPKLLNQYFVKSLSQTTNSEGREITQPIKYAEALAVGNRKAADEAFNDRRSSVSAWQSDEAARGGRPELDIAPDLLSGGSREVTPFDETMDMLRDSGVVSNETLGDDQGMLRVTPDLQGDELVHDLTPFENAMLPLFTDRPVSAAQSVAGMRRWFLGKDGLRSYLLENHPEAKSGQIPFEPLENEAAAIDRGGRRGSENKILRAEKISAAKEELPRLETQMKTILDMLKKPEERSNWQNVSILTESLRDVVQKIDANKKLIGENKKDGGGGPGIHDGKGGFFGNMWGKIKNIIPDNTISYVNPAATAFADEVTPPGETLSMPETPSPKKYNIRGVEVTDEDFNRIAPALFGEISNRPDERRDFETRIALNTALNRIINNPKNHGWGATLPEVIERPGQYQGYAPHGTVNERGQTVKSQYQLAKEGALDEAGKKKYQVILDTLEDIKKNGLEDTASGNMFYTHASDGTIWLGATVEEAINNAKSHEAKNGLKKTPFGTTRGMAAKTVN